MSQFVKHNFLQWGFLITQLNRKPVGPPLSAVRNLLRLPSTYAVMELKKYREAFSDALCFVVLGMLLVGTATRCRIKPLPVGFYQKKTILQNWKHLDWNNSVSRNSQRARLYVVLWRSVAWSTKLVLFTQCLGVRHRPCQVEQLNAT